jgi:anti-sigma factor RsiW
VTTPSTPDSACDRTTLALPWLLNGSLEAAERREVREHLIRCPQCRAELARTRETLAVFRAAAAAQSAPVVAAAAGPSRFASRGRVLGPLSWAATIAALLTAGVGTWLIGTGSSETPATPTARRERPAPIRAADAAKPAPATNAAPATTIADAAAPTRQPAVATPRTVTNPAPQRAPAPAPTQAAQPATKPVKTPAQPVVIFMTSFESGSLAPLANGAVEVASGSSPRISTADFENGELTWQ